MTTKIAAGIIGTGFIGPAHVEAGRRLGNMEFIALAEYSDEMARDKAAALHIPRAYGDYHKLLADPDIQVVHNCTPNHLHFQVNKDILAAGKHVISEKPLAMTSAESRELVRLAQESGLIHAVDFNYRYYPLVQHAREMVKAGEVGDIFTMHGSYLQDWLYLATDWNWRLQPELSGESRAIADVGSHWCDLLQFITGLTITKVMADLRTVHKTRMKPKKEVETYAGKQLQPSDYEPQEINTEDYASVLFELSNGAHGVFTVSQVSAGRKNRLYFEIDGSKCASPGTRSVPTKCGWGIAKGPMNRWSKIRLCYTRRHANTRIIPEGTPKHTRTAPRTCSAMSTARWNAARCPPLRTGARLKTGIKRWLFATPSWPAIRGSTGRMSRINARHRTLEWCCLVND